MCAERAPQNPAREKGEGFTRGVWHEAAPTKKSVARSRREALQFRGKAGARLHAHRCGVPDALRET